jgi:hypothetical protein
LLQRPLRGANTVGRDARARDPGRRFHSRRRRRDRNALEKKNATARVLQLEVVVLLHDRSRCGRERDEREEAEDEQARIPDDFEERGKQEINAGKSGADDGDGPDVDREIGNPKRDLTRRAARMKIADLPM